VRIIVYGAGEPHGSAVLAFDLYGLSTPRIFFPKI